MSARSRRGREAPPSYAAGAYDNPYPAYYRGDELDDEVERRPRLVTPGRVLLLLLLVASGGVALYGIFLDRTQLQIPITVSGLAVFGVLLAAMALVSARSAADLGRSGSGGRAFVVAFFGGLCALGAAGSLAGALVLGIVAGTV